MPGGLEARCAECAAAGAIDAVVSVLAAHASSVQLCEQCCLLLCNLTSTPQAAEASLASGAVPAVLAALRAHTSSASLAAQAARALLNIAIHGDSPEACMSSVPDLVAAMTAHPASVLLAWHACWALTAIAFDCTAGKEACLAAGAVPVVVAVLTAHTRAGESATVVVHACKALGVLAICVPGQDACVAAGAIPAIVGALNELADNEGAVIEASFALKNLAWRSASHRAAIVAAGAVPLLAAVYARFRRSFYAYNARVALEKLGFSETGQPFADEGEDED